MIPEHHQFAFKIGRREYTYLHLTRLGLTPLDRFRTCHLLANAVEEVYGVSGLESMQPLPKCGLGLRPYIITHTGLPRS
ncbi:hypothetical protein [Streptosporangium sp. NPDC049046]|uniref:hypothetical protein n=1 Tax=unclassified Streptosporangium TaxID=2632669 RepID=UPI003434EC0D